jgi:hypothetical protein
MTVRYLSDEWLEALVEEAADLPEHAGLDCTIDVEISGSPDGKVRYHEVWEDGRLVAAGLGKADDSDVQFSLKYADAVALVAGDVSADVSFMQGRFKMDGAYELWLYRFRPVAASAEYRAYLDAVAGFTSFD